MDFFGHAATLSLHTEPLCSLETALDSGTRVVEMDVRKTIDNNHVCHDASYFGNKAIKNTRSEELEREGVLSLSHVACLTARFNIAVLFDIKETSGQAPVDIARQAAANGLDEQQIILGVRTLEQASRIADYNLNMNMLGFLSAAYIDTFADIAGAGSYFRLWDIDAAQANLETISARKLRAVVMTGFRGRDMDKDFVGEHYKNIPHPQPGETTVLRLQSLFHRGVHAVLVNNPGKACHVMSDPNDDLRTFPRYNWRSSALII